jgi:D-aminopeptidase
MRARDLGWTLGTRPPGRFNAITDVAGVRVGHASLIQGGPSEGPVGRTGVTIVDIAPDLRWRRRWFAGTHVLNGLGQLTGRDVIDTQGFLTGPVLLTGTRSVGTVYEAAVAWALQEDPEACDADLPIPVVGECDDSYLSDPAVTCGGAEVAAAAGALASGPVAEGSVGAGVGMHLFGFKGGIGTASRLVPRPDGGSPYTVGVLLLTNFGSPEDLRLPLGADARVLAPPGDPRPGSCIGLAVTDAPLHPQQLSRLAARIGFGLVRTGSVGRPGSGEIFLAVSTANGFLSTDPTHRGEFLADRPDTSLALMGDLYAATAEAAEEAVWNALVAATTMDGRQGRKLVAFPAASNPNGG